jgi:serine protease AprX
VAAPILPGADFYFQAEALSQLAGAPDYLLNDLAKKLAPIAGLPKSIHQADPEELRATVEAQLKERKIIATHYQHVDGSSFAAPIVASVAAQMLEANPKLSPQAIKNILISTADRLADQSPIRQGYGALNAHRAVEAAAQEKHTHPQCDFGPPRIESNRLVFRFHHDQAESVALAGEFNDWDASRNRLIKQTHGMWRAEIELPAPGRYLYKFVIDDSQWVDDPSNGLKIDDHHGGFNSVLHIF